MQFLCQFNLDVHYKSGKDHIVPDILLQLANINTEKLSPIYSELNALLATELNFITTIVQMNNKLWEQILSGYKVDK